MPSVWHSRAWIISRLWKLSHTVSCPGLLLAERIAHPSSIIPSGLNIYTEGEQHHISTTHPFTYGRERRPQVESDPSAPFGTPLLADIYQRQATLWEGSLEPACRHNELFRLCFGDDNHTVSDWEESRRWWVCRFSFVTAQQHSICQDKYICHVFFKTKKMCLIHRFKNLK